MHRIILRKRYAAWAIFTLIACQVLFLGVPWYEEEEVLNPDALPSGLNCEYEESTESGIGRSYEVLVGCSQVGDVWKADCRQAVIHPVREQFYGCSEEDPQPSHLRCNSIEVELDFSTSESHEFETEDACVEALGWLSQELRADCAAQLEIRYPSPISVTQTIECQSEFAEG